MGIPTRKNQVMLPAQGFAPQLVLGWPVFVLMEASRVSENRLQSTGVKFMMGMDSAFDIALQQTVKVPFYTFLFKIASRCNLDCDYCYMYHLADQSWQKQPKRMSRAVIVQAAMRIREHVQAHEIPEIAIVMHGGEPLLAGEEFLREFLSTMSSAISPICSISFGVQTNGTLLTPRIIELFSSYDVSVGVSLDGPPQVNDKHRLTMERTSSYDAVVKGLRLLNDYGKNNMFAGFLCVIDINNDPLEVYRHLRGFDPPSMDFLLPDGHYGSYPNGKVPGKITTPYADWLIPIFNEWYERMEPSPIIKHFQEIVDLMLGAPTSLESMGLGPVDLVVIETNGDIEAVDALKSTYESATSLGLNLFTNSFDDALNHVKIVHRQVGVASLAQTCRDCPVVQVCGGGYLPHRYDPINGFDNPSVYCSDLWKLIWHVRNRLVETFRGNLITSEQVSGS